MGLGQRLRTPPVATITLAALSVVSYFFLQGDLKSTSQHTTELVHRHQLKKISVRLFEDYCKVKHGGSKLCREFTPLIGVLYPRTDLKLIKHTKDTPPDKPTYELTKVYEAEKKEMAAAVKLTEQYRSIKNDDERYSYFNTVRDFVKARYDLSPEFLQLGSAPQYRQALQNYSHDLKQIHTHETWLSKINLSPKSILAAQFQHGSLLHLLLNMFNLIVFGIYVEQRIGGLALVLIYLTGGSLAMFAQINLMDNPATILLGASGNVNVVAGMFFVFFFSFSLRIFLPLIVTYEKFFAPTKLTLPLLLVVSDLSGAFGSNHDLVPNTNVAHFTHLSGFAWGAFWAFLIAKRQSLPWPFLYPNEQKDFQFLQKIDSLARKLVVGRHMLRYNFENFAVKHHVIGSILEDDHFQNPQAFFERNQATVFTYTHLQSVIAVYLQKKDYPQIRDLLKKAHPLMPLHLYLARLGQVNTLKLGDSLLADGQTWLAMQVYDSFLVRFPRTRQVGAVQATAEQVCNKISQMPGGKEKLGTYLRQARNSALQPYLASLLADDSAAPREAHGE